MPTHRDALFDAVVIGGSFAGLSVALQLVRARRSVLVIDEGNPRNRAANHAHGLISRDGHSPTAILETARTELGAYPSFEARRGRALSARRVEAGFEVALSDRSKVVGKRLVLAYGVVDDIDAVPGFAQCWGKTVLHCPYCHGYEVADQRLGLMVRNGDIVRLAHLYKDWSRTLTLFTDGPIDPMVAEAVRSMGIAVVEPAVLKLDHRDGKLSSVVTADGEYPLDALFAHPPHRPASRISADLGCEELEFEDGSSVIKVDFQHRTTVEHVYAVGDIARPLHSISAAIGDGAAAGIHCHQSFANLAASDH